MMQVRQQTVSATSQVWYFSIGAPGEALQQSITPAGTMGVSSLRKGWAKTPGSQALLGKAQTEAQLHLMSFVSTDPAMRSVKPPLFRSGGTTLVWT
jgi:hypothetical protein